MDFLFYDLIWFWDHPNAENNPQLGRFLGVNELSSVGFNNCELTLLLLS